MLPAGPIAAIERFMRSAAGIDYAAASADSLCFRQYDLLSAVGHQLFAESEIDQRLLPNGFEGGCRRLRSDRTDRLRRERSHGLLPYRASAGFPYRQMFDGAKNVETAGGAAGQHVRVGLYETVVPRLLSGDPGDIERSLLSRRPRSECGRHLRPHRSHPDLSVRRDVEPAHQYLRNAGLPVWRDAQHWCVRLSERSGVER